MIDGPHAFRILDVRPSTPHDDDGFMLRTRVAKSTRSSVFNSEILVHDGPGLQDSYYGMEFSHLV